MLRLDESTDEITDRLPAGNAIGVAPAGDKLWIVGDTVLTVDPTTNKRTLVFDPHNPIPRDNADSNGGDMAAIGQSLYLVGCGGAVFRIDPTTHVPTIAPLHQSGPCRTVAADGALWVTGTGEDGTGLLRKLDPKRLRITTNVTVGSHPAGVAYGAGSLWVANSGDGTVMRIDPATEQIVATIYVGGAPYDLAFTHGLVWVTIV